MDTLSSSSAKCASCGALKGQQRLACGGSVVAILLFRVAKGRSGQAIFCLDGDNGQAVDEEHRVEAPAVLPAVFDLIHYGEDVGLILGDTLRLQPAHRAEIARAQGDVRDDLDPLAQNVEQAALLQRLAESREELPFRRAGIVLLQPFPGLRLRALDEAQDKHPVRREGAVIVRFRVAAFVTLALRERGDQMLLQGFFRADIRGGNGHALPLFVRLISLGGPAGRGISPPRGRNATPERMCSAATGGRSLPRTFDRTFG